MALRVAQSNAPEVGRSHAASPDRFPASGIAGVAAVVCSLGLAGPQTGSLGSSATSLLCLALLVFGLPHGSLDIALIRRSAQMGRRQVTAAVLLYLGLAGAMYAVWCVAAALALASFLVIAVAHFAEDWTDDLPPFFAVGTAVALLTAPELLHHRAIVDIFASLIGKGSATTITDLSVLVAPVALIAAAIGIWLLIRSGQAMRALETGALISGMVLLPPIMGFAIFFCLSHSPRHFAAARAEVGGHDSEAALLTCGAMGIAALAYASRGNTMIEDKAIFAAFVTLSVLTVPHMIVPRVMNRQRALPI